VFYELGIAHTVKASESVLLITQTMKDVPFDLQPYHCIQYALEPAVKDVTRTRRVFTVVTLHENIRHEKYCGN